MNINELSLAVEVCHKAGVSLFAHGGQGIGKSTGIKHYCDSNFHFEDDTIPFGFIDLRCAQMEASEIRGLPDKDVESKRVIYYVPHELPMGEWISDKGNISGHTGSKKPKDTEEEKWSLHKGILLFDEINRGEDDVLNALFQLVYDRKVGEYELPTGWGVVVAGNPSGSNFSVNTFINDAAFKDRFCHVFISIDDKYKRNWVDYMLNSGLDDSLISKITQFCMMNDEHLYNNDMDYDSLVPIPSPRSWEMVAKIETALSTINLDSESYNKIRFDLISGLVGDIAGYYIEHSINILPSHIIENGVTSKYEKIFESLERGQLQAFMWALSSSATKLSNPSKDQLINVISFGKWLSEQHTSDNVDLAVSFFDILLESEQNSVVRSVSFANKSVAAILKKTGNQGKWYNVIEEDEELKRFLHRSHRGEL